MTQVEVYSLCLSAFVAISATRHKDTKRRFCYVLCNEKERSRFLRDASTGYPGEPELCHKEPFDVYLMNSLHDEGAEFYSVCLTPSSLHLNRISP